ncbi:MAG: serine/threonine-protein kinase [Isosphaeraceae bacterium]
MPRSTPNVETLFSAALEMKNPDARSAFLVRACEDVELRMRVERLLAAVPDSDDFLEAPALPPSRTIDPDPPPALEAPGATIGPYRLREVIGEGGMGTVYLAEQSEPVERRVALKVIKPGMDSKQVVARFEAEFQALALMEHPNIARVLDGGMTPSGRPYFVMELVRGLPITAYCNEHQLSIPERLELFVLVCRAVQHAHLKGVVHRDIKPSNVLITVVDGAAAPKVIDFGVAKATSGSLTEQTLLTGVHHVLGTPLYMSPEQAGLSGVDVDTRSDIYSLGVLLYELLTGTTPHDSETLKQVPLDEVRRIVREQEPPTPSARLRERGRSNATVSADARKRASVVRGELDWIVMKALEKDRTRRYETANDLAADVTRYLADEPVVASPPSRWYHARKFVRRHRNQIAAVGLISVLGLALAAALGRHAAERAAHRAETVSAVTRALDAAEHTARLARWTEALASVRQAESRLEPGDPSALRLRCRRLRADLEMVLRLDEIRQEMSAVKDDHFDTELADRLYGEAFREYGIDIETLSPDVVAQRMPTGPVREELIAALDDWLRVRRGAPVEDDSEWRRSLATTRARSDEPGWQRLLAAAQAVDPDPWRNRVRDAWLQGDQKVLRELAISAPLERLHPCDVLLLVANLDHDRAVTVLREAQQRRPDDFWLNHTLGIRLHQLGPARIDEAVGYLRTAAALRPESPGAALNIGHVLHEAERTLEAITAYEQAIRLKPDYAMAHGNLGWALVDAGRYGEAIRACREAIRLNPDNPAARANLGRALTEAGALDEAVAVLREALRLTPRNGSAARQLALACFAKGLGTFRAIHRFVDQNIVRLGSPRPFLQTLLDPGKPPMLQRHFVLNLLAACVLAAPARAGDLYYKTPGDPNSGNIYAVNENGGTPRVVLAHSEYALGNAVAMTRFNHAGSNGQALFQASNATGDLQLVFRAPNGQVVTRPVTNLSGQPYTLSTAYAPVLAQDDRFFSLRARDANAGRSMIWRLNVTVDEALHPAYVPPATFDDPRLQLVVDDATNGTENHGHTWSPDGTRMAYLDTWTDATGASWVSVRVKSMADGLVDPLTHPRLLDTPGPIAATNWTSMLRWSPVSDQILNGSKDGGIWACYANSPGVMTWVAQPITMTTKTQSINERVSYPLWRPDGLRIATAYTKLTTTTKTGVVTREQQPSVMSPTGWPVLKLLRTGTTNNQHTPLGWTP